MEQARRKFEVGKMLRSRYGQRGKSPKITPDVRKGLFEMTGKGADQMHHIKWKDRTSGAQEEDLFVFPGSKL